MAANADWQAGAAEPRRRELRLRLTPEIAAVLEAQYQVFGREEQDVALEVLGEWARLKHREAKMIVEALERVQQSRRDL